ncbi:ABC transporter substrate-binding protein [Amycolatopsis sp. MtRt-6]|uniref:substrate-binding periplasmic protein n=1 Tax=Amycolatopsis sp. MtRt-6 TaxID=2792782 RepID=UPI001A8C7B65|nr:ABC transporter substrate-binding protein [Amycolatopsis sp. MtRt-6]
MARRTMTAVAVLGTLSLAACSGADAGTSPAVAADCKPAHTFPTVKPKTLTVGVISSLPYSAVNPVSQKWEGIDAEFGAAIAAKECLTVTAVAVGGADAIQSLNAGKIDLLSAGAYITPARGEVVGQTDPLYYQYTVTVSATPAATIDALRGRRIGALSGAAYVEPLRAALGAGRVREYPSTSDLLADVKNNRVEVAVAASAEARYQIDKSGYSGLQVTRLVPGAATPDLRPIYGVDMPFAKTNTEFGKALNADIAALRADGTTQKILANWKQDDSLTLNGK